MKTKAILFTSLAFASLVGCNTLPQDQQEAKIEALIKEMTLEEKIGQLNQISGAGWLSPDIIGQVKAGQVGSILNEADPKTIRELQRVAVEETRLGIPILFARDIIHGFKTIFPIPLGQAATWNPDIVEKGARIAAIEASSVGIRWTFSPMVDVSRDPRWGRIAESFGEDTYLNATLGKAMVRGYQTDNLSNPTAIAACVKHFCGYGASETGRDYNTTWIPEVQLRDVYLPPFKACADEGAATFMCSFNDINGVPSTGNKHLNVDILRKEWGYKGVLVTDWASIQQMITHGFAEDMKHAANLAADASVDMDMMSYAYISELKKLIDEDKVKLSQIDNAVRNVLKLKYDLGLFNNPYATSNDTTFYAKESLETAKEAAAQSTIMLKNKSTLPIDKTAKIAVVGPLSDSGIDQVGTWSFDGEASQCVTPLKALKEMLGESKVIAEKGLTYSRDTNAKGIKKAVEVAKRADVIVFFAGEEAILSGEAKCRADISLPGAQTEMLRELKKTGKPIVLVVMAGRQLTIGEEVELADAVLYQFHGGTMAGPALADILMGYDCPSGRLPVTMPRMVGQVPMYYNIKNTGRPAENIVMMDDIEVGAGQFSLGATSYHLDAGSEPLFPFGFGLSYAQFRYSTPTLSSNEMNMNSTITVSCNITNISKIDAYETVQLYIRDHVGSLCRPIRELKDFKKILIKAGETQTVSFEIDADMLAFCHNDMKSYAETGYFSLWVAPNAKSGEEIRFILK